MKKKLVAFVLAFVIFFVGTIFGILVARTPFIGMLPVPLIRRPFPPSPKEMPREVIDRVAHELKLTPEQKTEFLTIVEKNKKTIDALFKEIEPKLRERFDSMETEIKTILNEKQKKKFDEITTKFKKFGPRP